MPRKRQFPQEQSEGWVTKNVFVVCLTKNIFEVTLFNRLKYSMNGIFIFFIAQFGKLNHACRRMC